MKAALIADHEARVRALEFKLDACFAALFESSSANGRAICGPI
jgi:hypothetical protein